MSDEAKREPIVPVGNPLRARGAIPVIAGALLGVLCMASSASPYLVVPLSLLAVSIVTAGLFELIGSFDDDARWDVTPAKAGVHGGDVDPRFRGDDGPRGRPLGWPALAGPLAALAACGGAVLVLLRLAVAGRLPIWGSATLIPAAFLATVVALFHFGERLGPWRLDEAGEARPLARRHGFWLVAVATLLYLPMLGNHGLIDPWETHYGEVAREMLARNDWTSPWWAQEDWFWSKPVLGFWIQAAAMALLGVRYQPGAILSGTTASGAPQPEWAVRMPVFLLTVMGVYLLYKGAARSFGRRAGLLGGLVVLTMPQFFLMAHQTMADMPFVAGIAASIGLLLLASRVDPDERVATHKLELWGWRPSVSLFHLVLGAVLVVSLPQILYLLSRNVSVITGEHFDLRFHGDVFSFGSPGNCGLPGNKACQDGLRPAVQRFEPVIQALVWIQGLALLLWLSWGERRKQRLVYLAAWLAASVATMAKGPAGIGLPVLAAIGWLLASGRWRELLRLEIPAGLCVFALAVLPWFVAMYVRHGQPFTDRLLFHDMFKRAFRHVHDTNRGVDTSFRYYVWQLGYATFPWTGLVPIALVRWLGRRDKAGYAAAATLCTWFLVGFALFSLMGTKFHHYILPVVPALGMLTGLLVADFFEEERDPDRRAMLGAVAAGGALLTLMVGRDLATSPIRLLHLFTYNYQRAWPKSLDYTSTVWLFAIAAAVVTFALVAARIRATVACALVALACTFTAWGLDVYFVELSPHWGQRELFVRYERERADKPGPLCAFQMNWKGENFYRGNHLAAFVSSGRAFTNWIAEEKKKGHKTFYFVTDHKRAKGLHNELGRPPTFEKLTDERLDNKFQLIRAVFD